MDLMNPGCEDEERGEHGDSAAYEEERRDVPLHFFLFVGGLRGGAEV